MSKIIQRNFSVGSEWLYYKLYTGYKTADFLLTEAIKPVADRLLAEGIIDKWFFIRYADPKHHLRVRFRCVNSEYLGAIISSLYGSLETYIQEDLIWKVQLETYQRELERYGLNTMELSETLFYYNSIAIVEFLELIEGDEGEQLRWLFGLRLTDCFLDTFEYEIDDKLAFLDLLKTNFGNEFGMSRPLKKQLDDKFRKQRKNIENFLSFTEKEEPDYAPLLKIFSKSQKTMSPIAIEINKILIKDSFLINRDNLMGSYIHMLMNRLFKSKNRFNEMVCYDFLYRYYRSQISRKRN